MEIGLYIAELLGEQDEVSVPGLGTFIKLRIAGSFDELSNVFNPPSYQLAFKEENVSYSGLSHYISSHKNLSIASAEELIKKFISGIKDSLNNSDTSEIKHLGSLYKENDVLTFKAAENFEITGSFYGLKPIAERIIEPSLPPQDQKLIQDKDEIDAPNYTKPFEAQDEVDSDTETPKARLIPILIISFLAIIATLATLFYFDSSFNQFVKNMYASKESSTQAAEPFIDTMNTSASLGLIPGTVDSNMNIKDTLAENVKSSPKPSTPVTKLEQTPSLNEGIIYEIIVASFYKESEAKEYIRNAETKGIKAKIVENIPGKMHKISMGTFKDEESANKELERIQKEINKDAWIARVKPLNNPQ